MPPERTLDHVPDLAKKVFITAALTGSGSTQNKNLNVPRPAAISEAALRLQRPEQLWCIVMRDPKTGEPAVNRLIYREVTELIRAANVDLVLNLTAGWVAIWSLVRLMRLCR